jgi:hypothetical protein
MAKKEQEEMTALSEQKSPVELAKLAIFFSKENHANYGQTAKNIIDNIQNNGYKIVSLYEEYKTTGKGSQNSGIHLNCDNIARAYNEQQGDKDGYTMKQIRYMAIDNAVIRGTWPCKTSPSGKKIPKDYDYKTTKDEAKALIYELQKMCEWLNIPYLRDPDKENQFYANTM